MNGKHIDLRVENHPDKAGDYWRMVDLNGDENDRFKNPRAKIPDTIRWHAPEEHDICIVVLSRSPFSRNGEEIARQIIDIPAGGTSDKYEIAAVPKGVYEYAALVRHGDLDYTYVQGEQSPPGVVVEPHY